MERWEGKVAVVTGASAGMGAATAKALVEKGLKVVGLARRVERMRDLAAALSAAPGTLHPLSCDITNEEAILKSFRWITDNVGPVQVLINNAGLTRPASLIEGATDEWRRVFDVNVMAVCICTREAVKIMRERSLEGHVILMNSVAGHYVPNMPKPNFNVYPASKFAVTALTESLRQELRYHKCPIKITSISPGLVRTELQEGLPDKEAMNSLVSLNPEDVSQAIVYVLSTPPHVQVQELTIRPLGELL